MSDNDIGDFICREHCARARFLHSRASNPPQPPRGHCWVQRRDASGRIRSAAHSPFHSRSSRLGAAPEARAARSCQALRAARGPVLGRQNQLHQPPPRCRTAAPARERCAQARPPALAPRKWTPTPEAAPRLRRGRDSDTRPRRASAVHAPPGPASRDRARPATAGRRTRRLGARTGRAARVEGIARQEGRIGAAAAAAGDAPAGYPGSNVGPEPTTDRFVAIMHGTVRSRPTPAALPRRAPPPGCPPRSSPAARYPATRTRRQFMSRLR